MSIYKRFIEDLDGNQPTTYLVADNGCWLWRGALTSGGYPEVVGPNNKILYAHRVSYEHEHGEIPADKRIKTWHVHHKCLSRNCVNPEHLKLIHVSQHNRITHAATRARRVRCMSGLHAWIPENLKATGQKDYQTCKLCRQLYRAKPSIITKTRIRQTSPEYRAQRRAYSKARYLLPENKEKRRIYNREYNEKRKKRPDTN